MMVQASVRKTDQPKSIAPDMIHVRVDDGDHRRHRHHGFERIAALGQD
jgi:hypothetical protein